MYKAITLKQEFRYSDEMLTTGCTWSCQNPNSSAESDDNFLKITFYFQCTVDSPNARSWYLLYDCHFSAKNTHQSCLTEQNLLGIISGCEGHTSSGPCRWILPKLLPELECARTMGHIYIGNWACSTTLPYSNDDVIKWKLFRVTGPLCGEFTGHRWIPLTKASDAELWWFLWSAPWINDWVNNHEAGDLRRQRAHYDVIITVKGVVIHLGIGSLQPCELGRLKQLVGVTFEQQLLFKCRTNQLLKSYQQESFINECKPRASTKCW